MTMGHLCSRFVGIWGQGAGGEEVGSDLRQGGKVTEQPSHPLLLGPSEEHHRRRSRRAEPGCGGGGGGVKGDGRAWRDGGPGGGWEREGWPGEEEGGGGGGVTGGGKGKGRGQSSPASRRPRRRRAAADQRWRRAGTARDVGTGVGWEREGRVAAAAAAEQPSQPSSTCGGGGPGMDGRRIAEPLELVHAGLDFVAPT